MYGGLGLDGKIISVRPKCNEEFYGKKMSVKEILLGKLDPRNIENEDYDLVTHLLDAYCVDDIKLNDQDSKEQDKEKPDGTMKQTAVFGRDVNELECTKLKGYKSEIPNILITLKDALYKYEGHLIQGIFRKAAKKSKVKQIKDMIDDGLLYDIDFTEIDGKIIAQLIKLWYRECPILVLDGISEDMIERVETITDAQGVIDIMNQPQISYYYWLIDLCLEIEKYSDISDL